jgi:glutamyl-tRNA reductase
MAFNILGINHKTAPVALREKVAFGEDRLVAALRTLRQENGVAEVVILSTCNRTEVYWSGPASGAELSQWLQRHHGNNLDLAASLYIHQESRAVEHAFSVASGLDSMVLGEAQILGQLKDAYRVAQETGSTGPALNKLFQAAFSAAKRVRSETRIGANAVSLASATVSLARRVYADLSAHNVLLIGAGDMNALTAPHGHRQPQLGPRAGTGERAASTRGGFERFGPGIGGSGYRHQLYGESCGPGDQARGRGGHPRAAPAADLHGGYGGAARYRARSRRVGGRLSFFHR